MKKTSLFIIIFGITSITYTQRAVRFCGNFASKCPEDYVCISGKCSKKLSLPEGTYQKTCSNCTAGTNIDTGKKELTCEKCPWTGELWGDIVVPTKLISYDKCKKDIANCRGTLTCGRC